MTQPLPRRALLRTARNLALPIGALSLGLPFGLTGRARAAVEALTLLVANPQHGPLAPWARLCAQAAGAGLNFSGGLDGVTGGNQFDAIAMPDGQMALLLPGIALVAATTGDPRVRFTTSRLAPLAAACADGVIVLRPGAAPTRVACRGPYAPGAAAVLLLHLAGRTVRPVTAGTPPDALMVDGLAALETGQADAALLRGADLPAQLARAARAGAQPLLRLTASGPVAATDAAAPMASAIMAAIGQETALGAAALAIAQASRAAWLLALPALTPQQAASPWHDAAALIAADDQATHHAAAAGLILADAASGAHMLDALRLDSATQLALHRFTAATWS